MVHIEYIADLDDEKPIALSKADRERIINQDKEIEAKEQALKNPYKYEKKYIINK